MKYALLSTGAILMGVILDLIFADPSWLPHPVIIMGRAISSLEKKLRKNCTTDAETEAAGKKLSIILPLGTFLISGTCVILAYVIDPMLGFALESFWCAQCLSMKGLKQASMKVYDCLKRGDLPEARVAVSWIVGRDTQELSEEGVAKAAIETVAENSGDGTLSPLFYMLLLGAAGGLTYKAVNTLDSMVGYKNDKYLHFGKASALQDDFFNFIPARVAALCWIAAAFLLGYDGKAAYRIWKRDRFNHASPNSAQTESTCAGALGIQLAGPAYYFGEFYDKPTIGDRTRPVEFEDIKRSNRLMYGAGILASLIIVGLKALVILGVMNFL